MALTLVTDPSQVALAKNKVEVVLNNNNNHITSVGYPAWLKLNFTGTPADGDTFIVTILGTSYTFTAKDTPDDSGFQFPTNTGILSTANYIKYVFVEKFLQGNKIFSDHYYFTYTSTSVEIIALRNGTLYNFSAITNTLTGVAVAPGFPTVGINDAYRSNYKINLELYDGDMRTANPVLICTKQGDPNDSGDVTFEIEGQLRSILGYDIPAYSLIHSICTNCYKRFSFAYFESYGSPVANKLRYIAYETVDPMPFMALNGGFSPLLFALPNRNNLLSTYVTGTNKFLTNAPQAKRTNADCTEFLHYFVPETATYKAKITAEYSDGTTATAYYYSFGTLTKGQLVNFPTDITNTGALGITPAKQLTGYYITIFKVGSPDTAASQNFYYRVDPRHYESNTWFLYANKFGVMEVAWMRGKLTTGKEFQAVEAIYNIQPGYTEQGSELVQFNHKFRGIYTVATGFLTTDEAEHIHELISSPLVYIYQGMRGDAPILHRVLIEQGSMEDMYDDQQGLYGFKIKFKNSFLNA